MVALVGSVVNKLLSTRFFTRVKALQSWKEVFLSLNKHNRILYTTLLSNPVMSSALLLQGPVKSNELVHLNLTTRDTVSTPSILREESESDSTYSFNTSQLRCFLSEQLVTRIGNLHKELQRINHA